MTTTDQGTWEWVWNQYTSLGEHGVLKNTKTKDPKSYDDTWKTEFRKEKYG